jgi:hypothetical protein
VKPRDEDPLRRHPPPGIPLLGGIATGMTEDEAEALRPALETDGEIVALEQVVGHVQPGIVFEPGAGAVAILMDLGRRMPRLIDRLDRRFGRAIELTGGGRWIESYDRMRPGTRFERSYHLVWCDGPRRWSLKGWSDDYSLSVDSQSDAPGP